MGRVKVMIVEDDPMVSFLHKALIVKRNICSSPKDFMNGIEALDYLLRDSENEPDALYLILLDINMPLMNGWEFLEALKDCEVASRTEIIIVTSSPDREDREKASQCSLVTDYIEKPLVNFDPVIRIKRELEEKLS